MTCGANNAPIFFHWLWRSDQPAVSEADKARFAEGFGALQLGGSWAAADGRSGEPPPIRADWVVLWDMRARVPVKEFLKLEPLCRESVDLVAGVRFGPKRLIQRQGPKSSLSLFGAIHSLGLGWLGNDPEPPLLLFRGDLWGGIHPESGLYRDYVKRLMRRASERSRGILRRQIQWIDGPL